MKYILPFFILMSVLLCPLCMAEDRKPASGEELLNSIIKKPGDFDQMCSIDIVEQSVPIPLFMPVQRHMFNVSAKNLDLLRAQRVGVVPVIVRVLATWENGKKQKASGSEVADTIMGPVDVNFLYYQIIVGLNAVETLPELLRIEDQVHQRLAKMEVASSPQTAQEFWQARIDERELLSVMLRLLRSQRFQPLLDSDFEKTYAKAIKARAVEKDLLDIKTPEQAKAQGAAFDPIYQIPVGYISPKPGIPYTEKRREEVRSLVEAFDKTVPPEKWIVSAQ